MHQILIGHLSPAKVAWWMAWLIASMLVAPPIAVSTPLRQATRQAAESATVLPAAPFVELTPAALQLSPSPTGTATPGTRPASNGLNPLEEVDKWLTTALFGLLKLAATLVTVVLAVLLVQRAWDWLTASDQLLVEPLTNASGITDLDRSTTGLSAILRERLIEELRYLDRRLDEYRSHGPSSYTRTEESPLPRAALNTDLTTLVTAVQAVVPAEIKPALALVGLLFSPNGARVTGSLQRRGGPAEQLGITAEMGDLRQAGSPELYTIWELPNTSQAAAAAAQAHEQHVSAVSPAGTAMPYLQVAAQLERIGLLPDAARFLAQALSADPGSYEAASAMARIAACLPDRARSAASYLAGDTARTSGGRAEAAEHYVEALPPPSRNDARAAWRVVLDIASPGLAATAAANEAAGAYLCLARLYDKDEVGLREQALRLYAEAASAGSREAADLLARRKHETAALLVEVARQLLALQCFNDADHFLTLALDKVPDDPAAGVLAWAIKQELPPQSDREALALAVVGALYEGQSDLDSARTRYEQALAKQPSLNLAQDGFQRVVARKQLTAERYMVLLKPAATWLAHILAARSMLKHMPRACRRSVTARGLYRAQVHNYIGALLQSEGSQFYPAAVVQLQLARSAAPAWYRPWENLADTYSFWGRQLSGDDAVRRQKLAIEAYTEALSRVEHGQPSYPLRLHLDFPREPAATVQQRVTVGRALARLLAGIDQAAALTDITRVEQALGNLGTVSDARLLYNLAAWHSRYAWTTADKPTQDIQRELACTHLAWALLREQNRAFWSQTDSDPDFDADIRARIDLLKSVLQPAIRVAPQSTDSSEIPYEEAVVRAVSHATALAAPALRTRSPGA